MNEPEINLRPYGEIPRGRQAGAIWVYDDPAASVARAEAKLGAWLGGAREDAFVGRAVWWPALVGAVATALVVLGIVLSFSAGSPLAAILFWPPGFGLLIYALRVWSQSAPDSPVRCAREFIRAIARADHTRAYSLLAPVDKDEYLRPVPTGKLRDPGAVERLAFDSVAGFARYWGTARAVGSSDRLQMTIAGELRMLSPDVAVVPLRISVARSLRLQNIAPHVSVGKIILRYGNEWRIFDGEVLSAAEADNRWIRLPQE